jgi:diguanylate cyclase (GGDEF)-like protein
MRRRNLGYTSRTGAVGARILGIHPASHLAVITRNFRHLVASAWLAPCLVSARFHDPLLSHQRMQFLADRFGAAALFLSIATLAWIPIDIVLIGMQSATTWWLIIGRVVASAFFVALASLRLLSLTMGAGVVFLAYTHMVIAVLGGEAGIGHAQYLLMPIALSAGIAIFPLTLIEALALASAPLAALLFEVVHGDGGSFWMHVGTAAGLMGAITLTTIVCSVSQLKLLIDLQEHAAIDPLPGALARRAGIELLSLTFAQAHRTGAPLSIVLFDLDHFKSVNDRFGHEGGDAVLKEVVHNLRGRIRSQDALIRWGGEEFVLVLPATGGHVAASITANFCRAGLCHKPDGSAQTVSAGVVSWPDAAVASWHDMIRTADQRMYAAKALGRNRLVTADNQSICFAPPRSDSERADPAPSTGRVTGSLSAAT